MQPFSAAPTFWLPLPQVPCGKVTLEEWIIPKTFFSRFRLRQLSHWWVRLGAERQIQVMYLVRLWHALQTSKASPHPCPVWSAHRAYRCWLSPFFGAITGDQVCNSPSSNRRPKLLMLYPYDRMGPCMLGVLLFRRWSRFYWWQWDLRLHHGRRQSFAWCDQKLQSAALACFCEQGCYLTECGQCAKCAIRGEDQAYTSAKL